MDTALTNARRPSPHLPGGEVPRVVDADRPWVSQQARLQRFAEWVVNSLFPAEPLKLGYHPPSPQLLSPLRSHSPPPASVGGNGEPEVPPSQVRARALGAHVLVAKTHAEACCHLLPT